MKETTITDPEDADLVDMDNDFDDWIEEEDSNQVNFSYFLFISFSGYAHVYWRCNKCRNNSKITVLKCHKIK